MWRPTCMHPCHILQAHHGIPHLFDGDHVQLFHVFGRGVGLNHPVKRANALVTRGQHNVLAIQCARDIHRRKPVRQQLNRVQIHHDIARLPPVRVGNSSPRHGNKCRADKVGGHVVNLRGRHGGGRHLQRNNRHRGRIISQHQWWGRTRGHLLDNCLRYRGNLGLRHRCIRTGLEVDLHNPAAVIGLALDMLDIIHGRGQGALVIIHHAARHILGHQARIGPDHCHNRNTNTGKYVCRRIEYPPDSEH